MTYNKRVWAHVLIIAVLQLSLARVTNGAAPDATLRDADKARQKAEQDPDVRAAMRDFEDAEAKARALYDRQQATARQIAVKRLQVREDHAVRAGNLDLAMSIRQIIDWLKLQTQTDSQAARPGVGGAEPKSRTSSAAEYAGQWRYDDGSLLMLLADGRFIASGGPGRWEVAEGTLVARFDGGLVVHTFTDRGPNRMAGHDQDGHELVLRRMPVVPPDAKGHPCLPPDVLVGTWAEDDGKRFVLAPNGLFAYDGAAEGYWQDTAGAVVLYFHGGRIDTYTKLAGNRLSGTSTDANKHSVAITKQPAR